MNKINPSNAILNFLYFSTCNTNAEKFEWSQVLLAKLTNAEVYMHTNTLAKQMLRSCL